MYFYLILFLWPTFCIPECTGNFPNIISDVCWQCMFPLRVGGVKVANGEEANSPRSSFCLCPKPPLNQPTPGIVISYFEPVRMVDVTRTPFCLVNMGGLCLGKEDPTDPQKKGTVELIEGEGGLKRSFFHVHWYVFPVFALFELFSDLTCFESAKFDVAFLTEFDPLWMRDEMALIMNPEAILFGNPLAQTACAADCAKASFGFSLDSLFWCAGCHGSLYPFTGSVAAHVSGVQATELIVARFMAHLHRLGLLNRYYGKNPCHSRPCPIITKSMYKLQLLNPVPSPQQCSPIGRSDFLHPRHPVREIIEGAMNYGYLIFRRRECCFL